MFKLLTVYKLIIKYKIFVYMKHKYLLSDWVVYSSDELKYRRNTHKHAYIITD